MICTNIQHYVINRNRTVTDKESACNAGDIGDAGSIPGSGRSRGEGNGNPLQYSWLKSPMDRRVWQTTVQRVAKSHKWHDWASKHNHTNTMTVRWCLIYERKLNQKFDHSITISRVLQIFIQVDLAFIIMLYIQFSHLFHYLTTLNKYTDSLLRIYPDIYLVVEQTSIKISSYRFYTLGHNTSKN